MGVTLDKMVLPVLQVEKLEIVGYIPAESFRGEIVQAGNELEEFVPRQFFKKIGAVRYISCILFSLSRIVRQTASIDENLSSIRL